MTVNVSVSTHETVRLRSDTVIDPATVVSVRALLFGEMVQRAMPMIRCYYGDLFHDAQFLNEHLQLEDHTSTFTFQFAVKEAGTHIGTDLGYVLQLGSVKAFYEIRVRMEGLWWVAEFVQYDPTYARTALAA